jgi:HSP20 family molecular chaperone IbpA
MRTSERPMDSESDTFVAARLPGVRSEDIDMEINDREPAISGDVKDCERKGVRGDQEGGLASGPQAGRRSAAPSAPGQALRPPLSVAM